MKDFIFVVSAVFLITTVITFAVSSEISRTNNPTDKNKYCTHIGSYGICCEEMHSDANGVTLNKCEQGYDKIISAVNIYERK